MLQVFSVLHQEDTSWYQNSPWELSAASASDVCHPGRAVHSQWVTGHLRTMGSGFLPLFHPSSWFYSVTIHQRRSFQRTQGQITPWAGALVKLYIYGNYSSFPITIILVPSKVYEFWPRGGKKRLPSQSGFLQMSFMNWWDFLVILFHGPISHKQCQYLHP